MSRSGTVEERVIGVIAEILDVEEVRIGRCSMFRDDLGADSLDIVEVIMGLEEEFGIKIRDDELDDVATVGDAINHISNVLAHGVPAGE